MPALLACAVGLLLAMEWAFPLRRRRSSAGRRVLTNLLVSGVALAVGAFVVRPIAVRLVGWSADGHFGLLRMIPLPAWLQFALGLLLMDLTFYYWHRINHEIPLLWRFHSVHHLDPDMDVTTSFRFHAGEMLFSAGFRAVQVVLLGVSPPIYFVYEGVFQIATLFHHSNLRIPIRVERVLNRVFVTPRMHGVHHSVVRHEVNSNYSVVFCFWDRLHRTMMLNVPQAAIIIGVAGYLETADNTFLNLFLLPFRRRRSISAASEQPRLGQCPGSRTLMSE